MVSEGAVLGAQNRRGDTALHMAAGCGKEEVVEALLELGATLEQTNRDGNTALHMAASGGAWRRVPYVSLGPT